MILLKKLLSRSLTNPLKSGQLWAQFFGPTSHATFSEKKLIHFSA